MTHNQNVEMTRRYFDLPKKVLMRDSKIASQLIKAWDIEHDENKVFSLFLKNNHLLSSQRYWELLRTVWIVCGNLENVESFRLLMKAHNKNKYCFSTPEESRLLREMPDVFTVYRACNNENDRGISWTYELKYAEYYKEVFNKKLLIIKEVNKSDVFALINRNKEFEIIIL